MSASQRTHSQVHMRNNVQERGLAVKVAAVSRPDWLRNAAGLTDASYWRGTLQPRPTVNWWVVSHQQLVHWGARHLRDACLHGA